ncbi:MAG: hypothetical protein ACM3TN_18325 [Alphaproteobacteria bacterium]
MPGKTVKLFAYVPSPLRVHAKGGRRQSQLRNPGFLMNGYKCGEAIEHLPVAQERNLWFGGSPMVRDGTRHATLSLQIPAATAGESFREIIADDNPIVKESR